MANGEFNINFELVPGPSLLFTCGEYSSFHVKGSRLSQFLKLLMEINSIALVGTFIWNPDTELVSFDYVLPIGDFSYEYLSGIICDYLSTARKYYRKIQSFCND